jgi:RNA polymerase sigma-70 factor (ECF subfamily)
LHRDALVRYAAKRIGDVTAAEDIVEDIFVRLLFGEDRLVIRTTFRRYLYGAVNVEVRRWLQRIDINGRVVAQITNGDGGSALLARVAPADERVWLSEFERDLDRAINALSPRRRRIFRLKHEDGRTIEEIALILGLTVREVDAHLTTIRCVVKVAMPDWL